MIVCHCNGVSDRAVRCAVEGGAADAEEVARTCGAGADCGACRLLVRSVVDEAQARRLLTSGAPRTR